MPEGNRREDPLANYLEWIEHRYDPGHYLGGTIPPYLRKGSLGPRARRLSGLMLIVSGIGSLAVVPLLVMPHGGVPTDLWSVLQLALTFGVAVLNSGAGVVMFRSASAREARSHEENADVL